MISDAVKYRNRFHAVPPPPGPDEPPGINLTNLEWWHYIGLNERHNLAMAVNPYLEDRLTHWQFVYTASAPTDKNPVETKPGQRKPAGTPEVARGREPDKKKAAQRHAFMALHLLNQTLSGIATRSGVMHSSLHRWHDGRSRLSPENHAKLATFLKVDPKTIPN